MQGQIVRRILSGLGWAVLFYLVGCKVAGAVAGTWAAAQNPRDEIAVAAAAGDDAVDAGQVFIAMAATVLGAAGAWFGVLPGTADSSQLSPSLSEINLEGPRPRLNRWLARAAIGLLAFFLLAAIALHLLRPEYDPRSRFLSEYAWGPYGNLMTAGLALSGASAIVLGLALQRSVTRSFWLVVGANSLALAGIGYMLCALFPTDLYAPGGGPYRDRTAAGVLHDNLATASAVCATLAFLLLPWACRRCARWRQFFRPAIIFACAAAAAFIIGGRVPREYAGLGQRLWVATTAACCLLVAYRLGSITSDGAKEYQDSEEGEAAMS